MPPEITFPGGKGAGVAVVSGAFDPATIEQMYLLSRDGFSEISNPGETVGGLNADVKKTDDINFTVGGWEGNWSAEALLKVGYDLPALDASIAEGVGRCINAYNEEINVGMKTIYDTGYLLQRYTKNSGYYKEHVDSTSTSAVGRQLAIVVYLNDVEEGGETYFPFSELYVKPRAGSAAVFPALWTHLHVAQTPVSDDKYIISTFVCVPTEDMDYQEITRD